MYTAQLIGAECVSVRLPSLAASCPNFIIDRKSLHARTKPPGKLVSTLPGEVFKYKSTGNGPKLGILPCNVLGNRIDIV